MVQNERTNTSNEQKSLPPKHKHYSLVRYASHRLAVMKQLCSNLLLNHSGENILAENLSDSVEEKKKKKRLRGKMKRNIQFSETVCCSSVETFHTTIHANEMTNDNI